ncbi:MAG: hypothetical protein ACRDI2_05345, partial [Chloroflexota bacterium]
MANPSPPLSPSSSFRRPRLRRREVYRLAAGAGALAAAGTRLGTLPVARAESPPSDPSAAPAAGPRAQQFGVNEAFRAAKFAERSGAGWTRWTVQWFNVQPQPGELNVHYFRDQEGRSILEQQVKAGFKVAAMVLGTPEWAAETPGLKTGTSVPKGLYAPVFIDGQPNPENTWGAFMFRLAERYQGLLDVFEVWNEVEIPTT